MTAYPTFSLDRRNPFTVATAATGLALLVTLLVAITPGPAGAASLLWLVCVALFWRYPIVGISAVAFTIPLQDGMWIETIIGAVNPTRYVSWALVFTFGVMVSTGTRIVLDRVAIMHMLVVTALVTSFAAGDVRMLSWIYEIYHWLLPLLVYIVGRSRVLTGRDRLWIIAAVGSGIVVASFAGFYQFASSAGPQSFKVGGMVRIFGTFGHPNTLAAFLVISLPLVIAVALTPLVTVGTVTRWIVRAGAGAGLVALVLTQSRSGWLALGAASAFLIFMAPRRAQRAVVAGALLIAVTVVALGMANDTPGLDRFASIVDSQPGRTQVTTATWGQLEREAHWGAARSMMLEHPWFGVGAAEFNDDFREHTPEWRFRVGRGQAHNGYLHMGAQAGIPGIAAFVGWIGTMLFALWRRLRQSTGMDLDLAAGAAACVVAYVVESVFEYMEVLSLPILLAIVLVVGLGGAPPQSIERRASVDALPAGTSV